MPTLTLKFSTDEKESAVVVEVAQALGWELALDDPGRTRAPSEIRNGWEVVRDHPYVEHPAIRRSFESSDAAHAAWTAIDDALEERLGYVPRAAALGL